MDLLSFKIVTNWFDKFNEKKSRNDSKCWIENKFSSDNWKSLSIWTDFVNKNKNSASSLDTKISL